jgi:hypothetical protein
MSGEQARQRGNFFRETIQILKDRVPLDRRDNRELLLGCFDMFMLWPLAEVEDVLEADEAAQLRAYKRGMDELRQEIVDRPVVSDGDIVVILATLFMLVVARETTMRDWATQDLDALAEEHDRVTNARTRAKVEQAARRQAEAIALREQGEKITYIARRLGISERRIYELLPQDMKNRR